MIPEYTIITDEGDIRRTNIRSEEDMIQMLESGFVIAILRDVNWTIEYCDVERTLDCEETEYRIVWKNAIWMCPDCGTTASDISIAEHDKDCTFVTPENVLIITPEMMKKTEDEIAKNRLKMDMVSDESISELDKKELQIKKLAHENGILRTELNKALNLLAQRPVMTKKQVQ